MDDTIYRQSAIDAMCDACSDWCDEGVCKKVSAIQKLPPAWLTLDGYSIEHLVIISKLLAKENLSPERVADALNDIGRIIALVRKESEEAMRKAVEQCMI